MGVQGQTAYSDAFGASSKGERHFKRQWGAPDERIRELQRSCGGAIVFKNQENGRGWMSIVFADH